jgi:hypothetical protein
VGDNRLIFDIGGNRYRLIGMPPSTRKRVLVRFVGTQAGRLARIGEGAAFVATDPQAGSDLAKPSPETEEAGGTGEEGEAGRFGDSGNRRNTSVDSSFGNVGSRISWKIPHS